MLRRSSTHRSIGVRSDWNSTTVSEAGDETETEDDKSRGPDSARRWTIFDDDNVPVTADSPDAHVEKYVRDQLKRVMSPDDPSLYEDEIEA